MSGAVPPPAARPLERAARVPRPVCPGCGRCGRGDPAPAPQRAPLQAGVARCGCGGRASPGGGAFHHCEGRLRSGAVPPPTARPLGRAVRVRHPRAVGAGVWVWGPNTVPLACMPCGGCVPRGWWGAVPGGGWPATVVRGAWCQALFSPGRPSSGAGSQGSATRVSRVRSVRAWGPSTGPTACALAGQRCSLWGWRKGVPGGGAFHNCEGRLRPGAVPPPTARPLGRAVGVRHPCAAGAGVWVWGPNTVSLACMPCGGCVPRWWLRAVPGGLACHRCEGRLASDAVPPPAARPLERAARVPRPVCPGCGGCGRGDPAPAPQRAPVRAGVARCGGGGRPSPGGVPSTIVRGV